MNEVMHFNKRIVITSLIGGMLEWAEYTFYAYMAVIFARLFFPSSETATGLLAAFAIFGVGYLMRPLGAIVFGYIGDKYGRRSALSLSMILMGLATFAMAILPTYAQVGFVAPLLLLCCRLIQGFAVSGELSGAAIFLIEHDQYKRPYFMGSLTGAAIALGTALGGLAAFIVSSPMLPTWSWRIPFLIGAMGCFIGLYLRLKLTETPDFVEAQQKHEILNSPLLYLFKSHQKEIVITMTLAAFVSISFYLCNVYYATFLIQQAHLSLQQATLATTFGQFCVMFAYPLMGYLGDKYDGRKIMLIGFLGMPLAAFLNYYFGQTDLVYFIFGSQFIYAIFNAAAIAPMFFFLCKLFPVVIRYSGNTIPWCISAAIFGGTAPILAQLNVDAGFYYFPVIYITIISLLSFVLVFNQTTR